MLKTKVVSRGADARQRLKRCKRSKFLVKIHLIFSVAIEGDKTWRVMEEHSWVVRKVPGYLESVPWDYGMCIEHIFDPLWSFLSNFFLLHPIHVSKKRYVKGQKICKWVQALLFLCLIFFCSILFMFRIAWDPAGKTLSNCQFFFATL